jgi:hypothetical protein
MTSETLTTLLHDLLDLAKDDVREDLHTNPTDTR